MSFLLHFSADTYKNLQADLIVKNKIDSVSFDLNNVSKTYEEQSSFDLKIFKELKDEDGNYTNLSSDCIDEELMTIPTGDKFKSLDDIFKENGQVIFTFSNNIYIAKKIELKTRLEYGKYNFEMLDLHYDIKDKLNPNAAPRHHTFSKYSEKRFSVKDVFENCSTRDFRCYYLDSKTIIICFKAPVWKVSASDYTESIKITLSCEGWSAAKKSVTYALNKDGELKELLRHKDDGGEEYSVIEQSGGDIRIDGKHYIRFTSNFPFTYPSNELLQYKTKYGEEYWHREIARQILSDYKYGRRTVSFEVPDVCFCKCDKKGIKLSRKNEEDKDVPDAVNISELKTGQRFLVSERKWTDDPNLYFAGGSYRESLIYKAGNKPEIYDQPRQYEITNLEYKYNGAFTVFVKGLEVPYALASKKEEKILNGNN